ncbi:MAG: hypothetical protein FWC36_04320 [Spirochaetes bacterium]|nr:hypothetical protein [Spirochaetota bacterium]
MLPGANRAAGNVAEWVRGDEGDFIKSKFLSNDTHYSGTDPDARISTKPGKA